MNSSEKTINGQTYGNPADNKKKAAAFFDVDGTIVDATIVHYYVYFATHGFSTVRRTVWLSGFIFKVIYYIILDKISRSRFNKAFYSNYKNMKSSRLEEISRELFSNMIQPRIYPEAVNCIKKHKEQGQLIILVSGSLDFIVKPLQEYLDADDALAAKLEQSEGLFTGRLTSLPIGDEEKSRIVKEFAGKRGIDLAQSYAYGDSAADLPMLNAVGKPNAVSPDKALRRSAQKNNWPIFNWERKSSKFKVQS